jgi:hypothetical protein
MKTKIKETIDGAIQMASNLNMYVDEAEFTPETIKAVEPELTTEVREMDEYIKTEHTFYQGVEVSVNHCPSAPALRVKMVSLLTLLIPLLMMSCSEVQLVAQVPIANTEDYTVHIKEYTASGQVYWMEWEPWVWYNEYQINVPKMMDVECLFISKVDGDTLAHVHFVATDKRVKCDTPVRFDGTTQYIGIDMPAADALFETYANTTER